MQNKLNSTATPKADSRVHRSLGAPNRSSSLAWLVHQSPLATGTAWSYGRAPNPSRELPCPGRAAADPSAAIESMMISMAAKRFSAWRDAAERETRRQEPIFLSSVTRSSTTQSYRTRRSLRMGQQIQRGVRMQGGKGVRAGREAYARFHPAGKPGSKKRRRGTCAPSCARGSHEAVARDCRARTCPSLVPLRFAGVRVRTEGCFWETHCLTGSDTTRVN